MQRRIRLILLYLLVVLLAAALLWQMIASTAARTVSIPDGREITIQQLSFGTNHEFVIGNIWYRMLASVTPRSWKGKLPVRFHTQKTTKPILMVCGEWILPGTNQPAPMLLVKEAGSQQTYKTFGNWIAGQGKNRLVMTWPIDNFPRRAKSVEFDICEWRTSRWDAVAHFKLPNPARPHIDRWQREPFPATRAANGMEFTIANFSEAKFVTTPWLPVFARNEVGTGFAGIFMVNKEGRPQSNWKVDRMTVRDPTGNEVASRRLTPSVRVADYLMFGLEGPVWSSESNWKLTADFVRGSDFPTNELCTIKGVPVPVSGVSTQILADAEANGISLIGVELQRMGRGINFYRINEDVAVEALLPEILPDTAVTLAEVRDDSGRTLLFEPSHRGIEEFHYGIQLYPDSKTLDLTFAMQKRVRVEWTVGLQRLERAKPKR